MEFYQPHHPENTQFGSGSTDGLHELLNPFKVQQPINNKARRDPRLSLYRTGTSEKYTAWRHHFHPRTSNPVVYDVHTNEVVWRHRDVQNTVTFPEGDIRDTGLTALNGLTPLMNLKPIGVAASGSAGDGMTDFAVTESGLVNLISTQFDIHAGDWVAAVFPSLERFTGSNQDDDRSADRFDPDLQPQRPVLESRIPAGLPTEKLMAVIVPINRLLDYHRPDACLMASAMNGMFHVPNIGANQCILPSYVRHQFLVNPTEFIASVRRPTQDLRDNCYNIDSDAIRTDIWHNFGLGKALNGARKGRAFQCLIGAPFALPRHEWEPRPESDATVAARDV